MTTQARAERERLCDLFLDVGPEAPTLCSGWTTRDLAAHLVVRERRPDAAIGIAKPFAGYMDRVRRAEARRDYADIVERVRSGPPRLSPTAVPAVDRLVNTVEFFVHHEDVRRAAAGWEPRQLDAGLEDELHNAFTKAIWILGRKSPARLVLRPAARPELATGRGDTTVTVTGPLGELVMFLHGRQDHANVELDGPPDAVEAVRTARFGI